MFGPFLLVSRTSPLRYVITIPAESRSVTITAQDRTITVVAQ